MYFEFIIFVFIAFFGTTYCLICSLKSWRNPAKLPPGPRGIPLFGYLPFLGTIPCKTVAQLSKKWGPIFTLKLGQFPVVFINDYQKMKELYKLETTTGRAHLPLFEKRGVFGLGLLEGEDWREVRKFLLRCLRDSGFGKRSMEGSIQEEVSQTINFIRKNLHKPMYLKPLIEVAVINALWFLMTSEKYDIEDPTKKKVADVLSEGLSDQNIVGIATFLPWLAKLIPNYSGYAKALKYFGAPEELATDIVQKHVKSYDPGNERDFIDQAMSKIYATTDESSMFYKDVGNTMSSSLGWALLYLSMWPDKQAKVHREIDAEIGRSRIPSIEDRGRMPYMESTMAEVMRFSTMVPFGLLHKSLEDIEFEGYSFPKGTLFLANLYHVFKDEEYWVDPNNFRPERFLSSDGKFKRDERLIPFFIGKRTCIGESLAMIEFFLFLTRLLQHFRFELSPDEPVPHIGPRSGFILPPPKHKLVIFERGQ
ncbi:cytochrome P450 2C23 isoform X2 [Folsomia candida]|uniref:cytochrome P450 2C23 isoform X2 n=1 Tax=Folsomia candida TaxID=158441 RepID=UPI0016050F16|nr:cytochrome P450 2C23 isoform X2 [Folsomia candida]